MLLDYCSLWWKIICCCSLHIFQRRFALDICLLEENFVHQNGQSIVMVAFGFVTGRRTKTRGKTHTILNSGSSLTINYAHNQKQWQSEDIYELVAVPRITSHYYRYHGWDPTSTYTSYWACITVDYSFSLRAYSSFGTTLSKMWTNTHLG